MLLDQLQSRMRAMEIRMEAHCKRKPSLPGQLHSERKAFFHDTARYLLQRITSVVNPA